MFFRGVGSPIGCDDQRFVVSRRCGGQPERRLHAVPDEARDFLSQLVLERLERRHAVRQSNVQRTGVRREKICGGKFNAVLEVVAVVSLGHRSSEIRSGADFPAPTTRGAKTPAWNAMVSPTRSSCQAARRVLHMHCDTY